MDDVKSSVFRHLQKLKQAVAHVESAVEEVEKIEKILEIVLAQHEQTLLANKRRGTGIHARALHKRAAEKFLVDVRGKTIEKIEGWESLEKRISMGENAIRTQFARGFRYGRGGAGYAFHRTVDGDILTIYRVSKMPKEALESFAGLLPPAREYVKNNVAHG